MEEPEEESVALPLVHVLISEEFFWNKVSNALVGLEREPRCPDWEGDVKSQILANPGVALVADLEEVRIDTLNLISQLRQEEGIPDLPMLGYCSHEKSELLDAAKALGLEVIPRSTFAASLVRVLNDLKLEPDENIEEE